MFTGITVIVMCLAVALWKSIRTAINVMKLGVRAMNNVPATIIYPIITVSLIFALLVCVCVSVITSVSICSPPRQQVLASCEKVFVLESACRIPLPDPLCTVLKSSFPSFRLAVIFSVITRWPAGVVDLCGRLSRLRWQDHARGHPSLQLHLRQRTSAIRSVWFTVCTGIVPALPC